MYSVDTPRLASFYPMAVFSPEWVALRWALAGGKPVRFLDLPATNAFVEREYAAREFDEGGEPRRGPPPVREDPIGALAAAGGYDDAERWWEDAIEHR